MPYAFYCQKLPPIVAGLRSNGLVFVVHVVYDVEERGAGTIVFLLFGTVFAKVHLRLMLCDDRLSVRVALIEEADSWHV